MTTWQDRGDDLAAKAPLQIKDLEKAIRFHSEGWWCAGPGGRLGGDGAEPKPEPRNSKPES